MKTFDLLFWVASAVCHIPSISETDNSLSVAFENVTRHLFQLETRMFINNHGIDSETMTWLMLENLNKNGMPFKLQNLKIDNKTILLNSSAFLTFDSFEKLRDFNKKLILTNEFFKPLQLFIYCQGAAINDINSLASIVKILPKEDETEVQADLSDIIQYEYFLVDDATFVRLMTFLWYSSGKCGKLHLQKVNRFNKLTKKWENDKFVFEKLKNFHNCEIIVNLIDTTPNEPGFTPIAKITPVIISTLNTHLNYRDQIYKTERFTTNPLLPKLVDLRIKEGCYDIVTRFEPL